MPSKLFITYTILTEKSTEEKEVKNNNF